MRDFLQMVSSLTKTSANINCLQKIIKAGKQSILKKKFPKSDQGDHRNWWPPFFPQFLRLPVVGYPSTLNLGNLMEKTFHVWGNVRYSWQTVSGYQWTWESETGEDIPQVRTLIHHVWLWKGQISPRWFLPSGLHLEVLLPQFRKIGANIHLWTQRRNAFYFRYYIEVIVITFIVRLRCTDFMMIPVSRCHSTGEIWCLIL